MDVFCDLHIHTGLSPCGDADMTPNNIVNMAVLKGLDIIAITDHNTTGNVAAVAACANQAGLICIPGMELETSEEVHFVCLFPDLATAAKADAWARAHALPLPNQPDILGEQLLFDAQDTVIGTEPRMLLSALTVSIYDCLPLLQSWGAIVYPAHIDRTAYSLVTNFGEIPEALGFTAAELSRHITPAEAHAAYPFLHRYRTVQASDAHYLEDISEAEHALPLSERSAAALFAYLR